MPTPIRMTFSTEGLVAVCQIVSRPTMTNDQHREAHQPQEDDGQRGVEAHPVHAMLPLVASGSAIGAAPDSASESRSGFQALLISSATDCAVLCSVSHQPRKASRSFVKRSFAVANSPCGAPSYSIKVDCAMPFAAARPAASIGTVLSSIP